MENQKNPKIIKAELLGFLGTLREKEKFCLNSSNSKYFEPVFESLFKDPEYSDSSGAFEKEILAAMISHSDCPKSIIDAVLQMKPFEGQSYIYQSSYIPTQKLSKVLKETINKINMQKNGRNDLTQEKFNTLVSLCKNPNLSRPDRLTLEKMCDLLSKNNDDSLISICVLYTKRDTWLCEKFSDFVQNGSYNQSTLINMIKNPLAKVHMLEFAAREVRNLEMVETLVRHPNISEEALISLKEKFPRMQEFINQRISSLNDDLED